MENFFSGLIIGATIGMCVGGIAVARNRRLAHKINTGINNVEDKLDEARENLVDKLQECDCNCNFDDQKNKNKK